MKHNHNNTKGLGYAPKEKVLKNGSLHEVEFLGTSKTQLYIAIYKHGFNSNFN